MADVSGDKARKALFSLLVVYIVVQAAIYASNGGMREGWIVLAIASLGALGLWVA